MRDNLPLKSVGGEVIRQPASSASKTDNDLTSAGWKLQSLNSAADTLLKSAKKLEKEVSLETQYWGHILSIKEKGWPISRLPKANQTLAVRFGCFESPAEFRDKGVAPLKRSDDGSVDLDISTTLKGQPKSLRAKVVQRDTTIACSSGRAEVMDDDSLDTKIVRARDNAFDSELFDELYREGRNLTNRGVQCQDNSISIPLEDDKTILVELVDQVRNVPPVLPNKSPKKYERIPQLVVIALRLLLLHSHRQNYRRRTGKPPAISERRIQRTPPSILRPIISYLQHRNATRDLRRGLEQIRKVLDNAGVDVLIGPFKEENELTKVLESEGTEESAEFVHDAMEALCGVLQTSAEIEMPIQGTKLSIQTRTYALGTQFRLVRAEEMTVDPKVDLILPEDAIYNDSSDILSLMADVLQTDLIRYISQSSNEWHSETPIWGELETKPNNNFHHQIRLELKPAKLELVWAIVNSMEQISAHTVKVWEDSPNGGSNVRLLQALDLMSSAPPETDVKAFAEQSLGYKIV